MTAIKNILLILFLSFSSAVLSQEICDNAIDDDSDGLIDLNDTTDCFCTGWFGEIVPEPVSHLPNCSFENMNCCPVNFSQIDCATGWQQPTYATPDYYNLCGFTLGLPESGLIPFPHGNGIAGGYCTASYKEYLGACLTTTLLAGTSYTIRLNMSSIQFSPSAGAPCIGWDITEFNYSPIPITIFGNANCVSLPLSPDNDDCPPGWTELGVAWYSPVNWWGTITATFIPLEDINSIIIGPPCIFPNDYPGFQESCVPYFYYDNLILNETSSFKDVYINRAGRYCDDDLRLEAYIDTINGSWQWYKSGIALIGENSSILNISANDLGVGIYSAVYTINGECALAIDSINLPPMPVAGVSIPPLCLGESVQFHDWSTIAQGSVNNWNWDFGDGTINSDIQNPFHSYEESGLYIVTLVVTQGSLCIDSISTTVTVYPPPTLEVVTDSIICIGESVQLNASGGASYIWSPSTSLNNNQLANPIAYPSSTTLYNVVVADTNNCIDSSLTQMIVVIEPDTLNFTIDWKISCEELTSELTNNSSEGEYLWEFGDGSTSTLSNPSHTFNYGESYIITLTNTSVCLDTVKKIFNLTNLIDTAQSITSNIITPNNDALNDCFSPTISDQLSECSEITIYNRWGNVVFEKEKGEEKCWDGKNKSDNTFLDAGTYFYIMKVNDVDIKHGTVTLIRD